MVEELAKWKSALSHRVSDFQEVTKALLTDFRRVHNVSLKTYKNLRGIINQIVPDPKSVKEEEFKMRNVIDITFLNENLCESLREHLKINECTELLESKDKLDGLTVNERAAERVSYSTDFNIIEKNYLFCVCILYMYCVI